MPAGTSVKLDIPSETALVDLVHAASEKMADMAGFGPDDAMNVALAVREAVINAMLHGNLKDVSRRVRVALTATDGEIQARVEDQGAGFDPALTPDPTAAENLLNTTGRGLLLIRAFVDEVTFNQPAQGGTEVTLIKRRVPGTRDSQQAQ